MFPPKFTLLPPTTILLYRPSNYLPLAAELFWLGLPPIRRGMLCLTRSSQHHPSIPAPTENFSGPATILLLKFCVKRHPGRQRNKKMDFDTLVDLAVALNYSGHYKSPSSPHLWRVHRFQFLGPQSYDFLKRFGAPRRNGE